MYWQAQTEIKHAHTKEVEEQLTEQKERADRLQNELDGLKVNRSVALPDFNPYIIKTVG